ncbi:TniQ family protein [Streptomyces sp. NPDC005551]|uniref:TniQ family protein n=1 Tax=Streptomyces sp. NPDC005551 TaxID=3364725 RepID=UPI003676A949
MRGVLRVAPLGGETTWSYLCRLAARYGMDSGMLLDGWRQANRHPRPRRGRPLSAVVEALFDEAGQEQLEELSGIPQTRLARALPTWQQGPAAFAPAGGARCASGGRAADGPWPGGLAAGRVRFQDARTFGSVAIACRLCTARRTGHPVHAVRYLPLWRRVCHRHQHWQSDAEPGHGEQPGWLDVATCPEIGHAQQRWPALARHAARRGHDPRRAFTLARTIVLGWWQQAPAWQAERIWPARVHRLTHGAADGPETVWSAAVRDAAVLPETIALAQALTHPACIRMAHADRDRVRPAGWGAGGRLVHHLGHRLNRPWLGPLLTVDYTSPLHTWVTAGRQENGG